MLKKFFMNALSSFVGAWVAILLLGAVVTIVVLGIAGSMVTGSETVSVKSRSVLELKLEGAIMERETADAPNPMQLMQGDFEQPQSLDAIVEALKIAAENKNIAALYLNCGAVSASPATFNAIREALLEFKKSGKKIYAYGDALFTGSYFVASEADRIYLNPAGELSMRGLGSTSLYFKNLLDKLGVTFQVVKVGSFKSAVEPYIMDEMSQPARAQLDTMFNNMWGFIREKISESRKGVTPALIDSLVSLRNITFAPASLAVESGLVDSLLYGREINDRLAQLVGVEKEKLNKVSPSILLGQTPWASSYTSKNQVAVLYACGDIADGNDKQINFEKLVPVIVRLAENENVKGMVLRVNSPGGSVFGSDQIGEALDYFMKKGKPLAVSMGDYAASGGYWISCCADKIFADPMTVTGSIGIYGLIPEFAGTLSKIGVSPQTVSTNPSADFPSGMKPMDERQLGVMQQYVDRGYDKFVSRVAKGRKMSKERVKAIAEGRVWDGIMARRIGLVDSLGGLDKAVDWTAGKAGISDRYEVAAYPQVEPNFWTIVAKQGGFGTSLISSGLKDNFEVLAEAYVRRILARERLQARMPEISVTFD